VIEIRVQRREILRLGIKDVVGDCQMGELNIRYKWGYKSCGALEVSNLNFHISRQYRRIGGGRRTHHLVSLIVHFGTNYRVQDFDNKAVNVSIV